MNETEERTFKPGLEVAPVERLSKESLQDLDRRSRELLADPGITCFSEPVAGIYRDAGCTVEPKESKKSWTVRIPDKVIRNALDSVPSNIVLGARNPSNALTLDSARPYVYFGTGSETNIFLESHLEQFRSVETPEHTITCPVYSETRGSIAKLARSARICNSLDHVDFFIRNVNPQDEAIREENKDVNVFFASLLYMTKHVQAGITDIKKLGHVMKLAEILAGGKEALQKNPLISFIACPIKSPLQMVKDTSEKVVELVKTGLPLVLSSSPQGGSTAPVQEEGIVMQINAEIIANIVLTQIVRPGAPVLYGAVPVRARTDNLHDFYGAPEFIHYNMDCAQMARYYGIPCYSSAGVGDAKRPGMQALMEKVPVLMGVASAGPQYIHYALGLLERTNLFSPLQAVLDNATLGMLKNVLRLPRFDTEDTEAALNEIRKITASSGIFARGIRKQLRRGVVSDAYAFAEDADTDNVLIRAQEKLEEILRGPGEILPQETIEEMYREVPGLLELNNFFETEGR